MSFSSDLNKFADHTERAGERVYRGSAFEIISSIIKRTPVDTGRLRGNWQTSLGSTVNGLVKSSASKAINKAFSVTNKAKLIDVIYSVNNLPYAAVVEYGLFPQGKGKTKKTVNGYSSQAVGGMLRLTIMEWKRAVDKRAKANR